MRIYLANLNRLGARERDEFAGKWIAIRWDGLAVLESDQDLMVVREKLRTKGLDPDDVFFEFVPVPGAAMVEHGGEIDIQPAPSE